MNCSFCANAGAADANSVTSVMPTRTPFIGFSLLDGMCRPCVLLATLKSNFCDIYHNSDNFFGLTGARLVTSRQTFVHRCQGAMGRRDEGMRKTLSGRSDARVHDKLCALLATLKSLYILALFCQKTRQHKLQIVSP